MVLRPFKGWMSWMSALVVLSLGTGSAIGGSNSGWEIVPAGPSPSPAGSPGGVVVQQTSSAINGESAADRLARLRATVAGGDGGNSVLSKVVATAPTPSPAPTVSVTPALVVERMRELDIAVPGRSVMQAVAGAPGSGDLNSGSRKGDMLDGVLEAQNDVSPGQPPDRANGVRSSSPSPSPSPTEGVMITGEEGSPSPSATASATPLATVSGRPTPTGSPGNFEPAVPLPTIEPAASPPAETGEIPRELPATSPSPSPGPSVEPSPLPPVQDKVYDLVSGQLPDRGAVRGPREPRVGFYPKAAEPRNAQNLFMEASGGDLPKEEARLW
jgi:hypothetical protein